VGGCVVISTLKPSKLELAVDLSERIEGLKIILLSDAIYMLDDKKLNYIVKRAATTGTSIYALSNDVEKRGLKINHKISIIDYEELVDILLMPDGITINL